MTKRIIAIIAALLLALSLFACTEPEQTEETTTGNKIEIPTTAGETTADETKSQENESNAPGSDTDKPSSSDAKNPGEYTYTDCNETLYVYIVGHVGDGEITLRSADYKYLGTIKQGDKVTRIGLSNDDDNYWSKVIVGDKTGYVATKFLTKINVLNPAGFVEVTKTVKINPLTGSLNVREIPSMDGDAIAWVNSEKPVKVIAENTEIGWYKVEAPTSDGKTVIGYIASNAEYFVQDKETTEETTEAATEEITTEAVVETEAESTSETMAPAGK